MDKRNQNRWLTIVISLLFVLLGAGCGDGAGNTSNGDVGSIQGTIFPIAEVVEVQLFRNGQQIDRTEPDSSGNYVFADLEPGTYEILAVAEGHRPLSLEAVGINAGQTITKNFTLEPLPTSLTGVVLGPDGLWVEHATVTLKSQNGQEVLETDQFGNFTFDEIWDGVKITLTVTAIGLEEQTIEVDVIGKGMTARVQIDMVAAE